MNVKTRLYSAIVGGIVGAIVAVFVTNFSPTAAQDSPPNLGDIVCTSLTVVNSENAKTGVTISSDDAGQGVILLNNGTISSIDADDRERLKLGSNVDGGYFMIVGTNEKPTVVAIDDEHNNGIVSVRSDTEAAAAIAVEPQAGGGTVVVVGEKGYMQAFPPRQ